MFTLEPLEDAKAAARETMLEPRVLNILSERRHSRTTILVTMNHFAGGSTTFVLTNDLVRLLLNIYIIIRLLYASRQTNAIWCARVRIPLGLSLAKSMKSENNGADRAHHQTRAHLPPEAK